jgi:DNA repair exonuclease SbcCD ATPase subunit
MKKEVEYALVTSSALPGEIQESEHYVGLEKEQWLDLVDYSAELVETDEKQEILFLIVAKGTTEQQAEDDARRASKGAAARALTSDKANLEQEVSELLSQINILEKELDERVDIQAKHDLLEKQLNDIMGSKTELKDELERLREAERLEDEREEQNLKNQQARQSALRTKSVNIFNALYQK